MTRLANGMLRTLRFQPCPARNPKTSFTVPAICPRSFIALPPSQFQTASSFSGCWSNARPTSGRSEPRSDLPPNAPRFSPPPRRLRSFATVCHAGAVFVRPMFDLTS